MGTLRGLAGLRACGGCVLLVAIAFTGTAYGQSARTRYETALARERAVDPEAASLKTLRGIVAAYEAVVRRHPSSPYSDNALWQAAGVAAHAYRRFGDERDKTATATLLQRLSAEYPTSSLARRAADRRNEIVGSVVGSAPPAPVPSAAPDPAPAVISNPSVPPMPVSAPRAATQGAARTLIRSIERVKLPEFVRIVMELDGEVSYREERLWEPDRLFFDLKNANAAPHLLDAQLTFDDDIVRRIRLGRHANSVTRVVLDVANVARYSVYTLYNPYRLVIDCTRTGTTLAAARVPNRVAPEPPPGPRAGPEASAAGASSAAPALPGAAESGAVPPQFASATAPSRLPARGPVEEVEPRPAPSRVEPPPVPPLPSNPAPAAVAMRATPPTAPSANSNGHFSIARQLGLGISRIVIDPGHGGHDPGAQASKLTEASLVLDLAQRLEKLLLKHPGVEVVMTRRTDVYVPLEERTAIANRAGADLFLSIHANASRNMSLGGVETYFLNFATNPAAEALAARENAVSGATMARLPDIVRAIALNNKLDESRDFAAAVQNAMVKKLRTQHRGLRDLGVKQAPFVVLIGAGMPSVLAEVSFVTNRDEGRLLRGTSYRQKIAEALYEAIQRYQRSLKSDATVAQQ